jgi:hypothetical protein
MQMQESGSPRKINMTSKDIVEIFLRDADLADLCRAANALGMRVVEENEYRRSLETTKDPIWAVAAELARIADAMAQTEIRTTLSRTLSAEEFRNRLKALAGKKPLPF